jgi:predicted lipoprotein with Yx(FWY)xxD motif
MPLSRRISYEKGDHPMQPSTSRPIFLRAPVLVVVAVLSAAVLLGAACSSGDDATPVPTSAATSPGAGAAATDAIVTLHMDSKFGQILATHAGLPLYTFNGDTPGKSNCTGGCLDEWPPLTTTASTVPPVAGAPGKFSLVKRSDGSMQVAYNGLPLYTFTDDKKGGDATGDGQDNFKVATAAPTASATTTTTSSSSGGGGYNY